MTISNLTSAVFLICCLISIRPFGSTGFSIKLILIDRFDTTLFPKNLTQEERYYRIFDISQTCVHQLEFAASLSSGGQKVSTEHGPNTLQPRVGMHPSRYYITTMTVGTPRFPISLVISTASDDTWTQCEGCTNCFPTSQGNFDRSKSRTYRPLAHNDPLCSSRVILNGSCMYNARGFSNGCFNCYSKGQVGLDTVGFLDGTRSLKEFPNTVFCCGLDNYNFGWAKRGQNNSISGLFGLGLGPRSIFSQYGNETKGRLSYCLPSIYSQLKTYTLLQFGDDASIGGPPGALIRTTTLIPNVTQYAVTVMGISVCAKRLYINPEVFRMRQNHTGGFVFVGSSPTCSGFDLKDLDDCSSRIPIDC